MIQQRIRDVVNVGNHANPPGYFSQARKHLAPRFAPQHDLPGYAGVWSSLADAPDILVVRAAAATPESHSQPAIDLVINKTLSGEMIASLIVRHVFRDHPRLMLVGAGVGWMAHLISWMDVLVREHGTLHAGLTALPSATLCRHVFGSFLWDTIGIDNIMWCSDCPHGDGPSPNSREKIQAGLTDEERHKIPAGNAARVSGLSSTAA